MLKRFVGLLLSVMTTVVFAYPETFEKTAQIMQFFETNPNAVWEGFNFNDSTTIVHNGSPELMAFHFKPDNANWVPMPDLASFGWYSIVDEHNLHQMKMHPHYPFNNTFAYVFGFNPTLENQDRAYQTFVHEKFHVFQSEHFKNIFVPGLAYEDHFNEVNQQLLFLENKALMALLQDLSSVERMKDVIAVYQYRQKHAKITENSRLWETMHTRMEGIAEYVDTVTFLALPILESDPLAVLSQTSARNFGWLEEKPVNMVNSSIKWRHYAVGAISGLALDKLGLDWKKSLQEGESPLDLLADHFNMSVPEIHQRVQHAYDQWFDPAQANKITQEILDYQDVLSAIRQKYNQSSGTEIVWPFSCASGGFTEKSYFLADGSVVDLLMSTRTTCREESTRFTLEMNRHPIVYQHPLQGVKFKVDATIVLNGRQLDAQTPSNGTLHRLYFKSPTVTLDYEGNACFAWDGQRLTVHAINDAHEACLL